MSNKREILYGTNSVPTSAGTAYTSTGNTHIDQATVLNDTGSAITVTVEVVISGGATVVLYNAYNLASGSGENLTRLVNHGLGTGDAIRVTASGSNLNMLISGRDF